MLANEKLFFMFYQPMLLEYKDQGISEMFLSCSCIPIGFSITHVMWFFLATKEVPYSGDPFGLTPLGSFHLSEDEFLQISRPMQSLVCTYAKKTMIL